MTLYWCPHWNTLNENKCETCISEHGFQAAYYRASDVHSALRDTLPSLYEIQQKLYQLRGPLTTGGYATAASDFHSWLIVRTMAEDFERAAAAIRAGDTAALASHLGRNRRFRAEDAAAGAQRQDIGDPKAHPDAL